MELLGPNHVDVAYSWHNIAVHYRKVGLIDESILCRLKALKILIDKFGTNSPDVGREYNGLGVVYQDKGMLEKAFEFYTKGLDVKLKLLGDKNPEIAYSYDNFALYYGKKHDYYKAIEYQKKALDIRLASFGEMNKGVATSYFNISNFYNNLELFDLAIQYQEKAIEILKTDSIVNGYELAIVYSGLSETLSATKEYDKAIVEQQKSLVLLKNLLGDEDATVAKSYRKLAKFYSKGGYFEIADSIFHLSLQALRYAEGASLSRVNSLSELKYTLIGKALFEQMRYSKTLNSSFLENARKDWKLALILITKENIGQFESEVEINLDAFQGLINTYLDLNRLEGTNSNINELFNILEESKSILLRSVMKEVQATAFAGIDSFLLQQERRLRIDITWREKQRQTLLDKGLTETDTNTLRISSIIFDLKRDYEALKKRFEIDYPAYYRLKYDLNTVSLRYVQDTLLQPQNQALLEYFVGDSSIYLFVVRPDTMIVQEVKRDFPLEDWIEQLRQGLYGYYTADQGKRTTALYNNTQKQYIEYAQKLYQKLVAPVQSWLLEQVIVVPDGPLGYIPFDALFTGPPPQDSNDFKSYPYLLNKHQFSYTYSATLLKEMCDKKHHHIPTKKFAAFAPFYTGDTSLLANMYAYDDLMRKDLQTLAYSGQEVAAASKLMNGEIIAGTAATEERFTSTAGNYHILHLATHGRADNRVGDYAFLAFTEIKDSIENELLYVKDLYNLELNADLVVLSACETGIGKLQRGEGIISLARAFAYAGAKSIVTTLWEVNDKSTSELMRYFYRELRKGKTKDEALRSARKAYLEKSKARTCHPFFWAAFVPIGDMRAVK